MGHGHNSNKYYIDDQTEGGGLMANHTVDVDDLNEDSPSTLFSFHFQD